MSAPTLVQAETPPRLSRRFLATPRAAFGPWPGRSAGLLLAVALAGVVGLFSARVVTIAGADSITSDEATHLVRCLHYWMTGDDLAMWELGAPRLPHALNALASYEALGSVDNLPRASGRDDLRRAISLLAASGSRRLLVPARLVTWLWGLALLGGVFWAVARERGRVTGLIAVAITAAVPEVVAHASIAGSDMPFTAAAFFALILMARYVERPSPGRWAALAGAMGVAWAMRHTALLLLMLAGIVHLVVHWRADRPRKPIEVAEWLLGSIGAGVGASLLAFLVLWAGDGFGTITLAEVSNRAMTVSVPRQIGPLDISGVPLPTSALSVLKQVRHQNHGHEAFLCGSYGNQGWPLYFPLAFLFKTPLALLALMILALVRVRPRSAWDAIALAFLGLLWMMLVRNKVNIGLRYALLTYPLAATFLARLFEPSLLRDRVWGPATVVASIGLVVASAGCWSRPLSYFNPVGGGPARGWIYLADSNVDWGQDFDRLAQAIPRLGIRELTYDVTSDRELVIPGVYTVANPSRAFQVPAETPPNRRLLDSEGGYIPVYTRYVAVSVSRLLGLYTQNDMSWLRTRRLAARVGDSIFIFDMDRPAERPLVD